MKQMFDIFDKLIVGQSDEIYGVNAFNWEDSPWKHLSVVGDDEVISLLHIKVYAFSDSENPPIRMCMGRQIEVVQKFTRI